MVNEKRLLEEFQTLASFDSESFHEKVISEYLIHKLKALELEVTVDDTGHKLYDNANATGNIYGYLKGNPDEEALLFSAHMDTVAPGKGKQVVLHEDGKVTSDGNTILGADDITGIAAILEMLTVIKEKKLSHPDIEVVFFIAEEPYCRGSSAFDFSKVKAKKAYVLDLSGAVGTIANQAPSIVQFRAHVKGKSAHAGFEPEKGISAISVAALAISKLTLGRIDERTTANIGTISGGKGKNIVPEETVVEGEIRSLNHEKAQEVVENIRIEFQKAADILGASIEFDVQEMIKAYQVDQTASVITRYEKALTALGYGKPTIITTFGGSDNNLFHQNGIEGIVISNAMNAVHTTEEYFYIDEFVKSAEITLALATVISD